MDDVLVIGAGPAGNHAALHLAKFGHKVTVVERRLTIGDKLCSGIVSAECLRRYPANAQDIYRAATSASVYSPSGRSLVISRSEPQAYILDRVAYVAGFAKQAQEAGATYLLGHTLHELRIERNGVSAIVANGAGPRTVQAKAVIIASGFGSRITKTAGLGRVRDYVTGVQAEVAAPSLEGIELYLGREVAPGFFAWLVPTQPGRAHLGLLARRDGTRHLHRLAEHLQASGKVTAVVKRPSRWGIPLRPLARTFGHRVLAVGDAAGQIKPATGGGIYYSLLTSQIAAETLHQALQAGDLSANRLSCYQQEWKRLLGREIEIGYSAGRLFEQLRDDQVDYLLQILAEDQAQPNVWELPNVSFDWHAAAIRLLFRMPAMDRAMDALGLVIPQMLRRANGSRSGR